MAESRFSENCKVTISDDSMSAYLRIDMPSNGIAYSVDELAGFLKAKGVYGGVVYSALEYMTQNNIYEQDYLVAKGQTPTEGSDGYYETFFDNNKNKKPAIRSDGSVDYQSMSEIENVSIGDKLLHYHKAIQGTNGFDVRGRALRTKPAKDLPEIKGSGFKIDDNTGVYTADMEGRIEYDGKTLRILDVYEHKGDLDLVVGKIDFRGDVVIKGNVRAGTVIRATKTITVEGSVEATTLIAGGDIILKKGMQGGNKARISCGGNVYANFLEFTHVEAKGKVEANIIMNCEISAGNDIKVSGKRGAIVGGNTYAIGLVESQNIGNTAGHKTAVAVGITKEIAEREVILNRKLESTRKSIERTKQEIARVSDARLTMEKKEVRQAKVSQLTRRMKRDENLLIHIEDELANIGYATGVGRHARIKVGGLVCPGVKVHVNDLAMAVTDTMRNVEFAKDPNEDKILVINC